MTKIKWRNVTYPKILQNKLCWFLWHKYLCNKGFHLFDEVSNGSEHYLYCDACDKVVQIKD